jgi:ankyrin repeat protein
MPPKRKAQVPAVKLQQECSQDQESTNKRARGAEGKEQQQKQQDHGLNLDCKHSMNLPPPPPQGDDPIITQFKPVEGQWELTEDNINRIDPETGHTILHNYCFCIDTTPLEVYRFLIETKGCDINVRDDDKNTPIHSALDHFSPTEDGSNVTVLTYLLSHGNVNVNTKSQDGTSTLHAACMNINSLPLEIFKLLIETKGCDINVQDNDKNTPIHYALYSFDPNDGGDITVLVYLLNEKGINVNLKSQSGYTSLHYACNNINKLQLEIFKLLIETHGAVVNVQDNDNNTPLHQAIRWFDPNQGGDINVLTYLLSQKGINANLKGIYGYTLLHWACININRLPLEIFKCLIETHGGDVNSQDEKNETPLCQALYYFKPHNGANITILNYLLNEKGINVNLKGNKNQTLLHYACKKINQIPINIYQYLIETLGADVNVPDNSDSTPLHQALAYFKPHNGGDITIFAYLINQNNTNVNIKDKNGYTLLHLACICEIVSSDYDDDDGHDEDDYDDVHDEDDYDDVHDDDDHDEDDHDDDDHDDYDDDHDDYDGDDDREDDYSSDDDDSDEDLEDSVIGDKLDQEADTVFCQIVEVIAERYVQQVLGETNLE